MWTIAGRVVVEVLLEPAEVVARWPSLEPLVVLRDPPWKFERLDSGVLTGARSHPTYAEALWVIDEQRTGMHRCPTSDFGGPVAATLNFSGSLSEAVELLLRPVRWEPDR